MHDRGRSALVHEVLFHRNSSCGTQAAHAAVRPRAVARGLAQPPRSGHEYSFPLRTRQNLHLLRRFGVLALFKLVARPSRMATRSSSHRPYRCTAFSSALPNREVPCTRHLSRACCQLWLPPLPVSTRVPKALASIQPLRLGWDAIHAPPPTLATCALAEVVVIGGWRLRTKGVGDPPQGPAPRTGHQEEEVVTGSCCRRCVCRCVALIATSR